MQFTDTLALSSENTARECFAAANALLGAKTADSAPSDAAFDTVIAAGHQPTRFYHRPAHFLDVASTHTPLKTWVDAVRLRAGLHHDVVYQPVDKKGSEKSGLMPQVKAMIDNYIDMTDDGRVMLKPAEKMPTDDPLLQGVLTLFAPNAGQPASNELLSALYAMEQGRSLGIADNYILAECAHIEGTIPFQPANHFEQLETRLRAANALLPEDKRLTDAQAVETIDSAVSMANRDMVSFQQPFDIFMDDTFNFLRENTTPIGTHADPLFHPLALFTICRKDSAFFGEFLQQQSDPDSGRIFHAAHGIPNASALAGMEALAHENIAKRNHYLTAHAAAAALIMAAAVERGTAANHVAFAAPLSADRLPTDALANFLQKKLGNDGVAQLVEKAGFMRADGAVLSKQQANDFLVHAETIFSACTAAMSDVSGYFPALVTAPVTAAPATSIHSAAPAVTRAAPPPAEHTIV